ncbi:uncharacterized protein LOC110072396 isoform X1 [Pogona vitticeps]
MYSDKTVWKMSLQETGETSSLFSVNGVKGRMKEKKHGVLKTSKLNVSLASKIRAKTINNSSIIKITLKQNNKALALALSAAKIAAQRLTDDKMILQKEVELCHFENACLRQKLSSVNKCVGELQQLMNRHLQAALKLSRFSENMSSSSLLNDEEHHWTDSIAGNQDGVNCLSQAAPKSLRIPLSHVDDDDNEQDRGLGMATVPSLPMRPSGVAAFGLGKSWDSVPPATAEKPFSSCHKESLASSGNHVQMLSEEDGTTLALDLSRVFADNLPSALQNSRNCSLSALSQGSRMEQDKDIARPCSDSVVLPHEHVTQRKKRRTGLSDTSGGSNCQVEPSDNVLLDDLQGPTEIESTAKKKLEVSQVGELLTLSSKNKNYRKIKANEAKALKKVSAGTKDNQEKRNVDSYNDALRPPETDRLNNSKKKTPKSAWFAEDSRQMDPLEETVALDGCSRKEEHSSKHFDGITVCRRSSVVNPSHVNDCNPLRTFSEKKKNIEIHFQNPETTTLCNQFQQDEMSSGHRGQRLSCSNKTRGIRRTYVIDPGSQQHKNDCSPSAHETKRNKHLEDSEELSSLFPNSRSSLLNSKAPLRAFSPQHLTDIQKEIPNQETTLGLNVKRIKSKRKTQELDMVPKFGETEGECFDVNMHSHTQPEESKVKKGPKSKAAKTGKGDTQREHCRTSVELFQPMENASRVKKRKTNLRMSTVSLSQTNAITLESMTPAPPVSMDDDDDPFDDIVRNSTKKPQKVQRSSGPQSTIYLNQTNSSSSQNVYLGGSSQAKDVKKRVDAKSKLNKRTTYTIKNLSEVCVASSSSLPSPEEGKTSQEDQLGWNFLRVPASRTQQEVLTGNVIEAPFQFVSVATGPSIPRSSAVDSTETILPDSCPSGHSPSVLGDAKSNSNPGRNSTLSPTSATFKKNYTKRVVSGRGRKKTVLATPEKALQDPTSQGNENNVLKDVTNANPHSHSSVSPEASPVLPSRRRNKAVSYAEPKLNSKLRRGDPYTVTDFLRSPIYKTKRKKMSKTSETSRKSKKIKQEEIQPTIDFIAAS